MGVLEIMIIYFIQEEPDGAVKIGQTSNIAKRLAHLQTSCSRPLKVLFSFDVPDEKANYAENHIHHCFRNRRMKGEWFSPCPYLYDYIKAISAGGFFVDWNEALKEESNGDKFNELYNKNFRMIEEIKEYGDIRRIEALVNDLEELVTYAKTGRN